MNHTDINKRIAEIKSVEEEYDILKYIPDIDYINGANSNRGLIEELLDTKLWELSKDDKGYLWWRPSDNVRDEHLGLATALAYLKMKGIEYE